MKRPSGFTVLELLVVLMVGGVITSMAVRSFSDVRDRLVQRQSLRTFQAMHARARAMAIESGTYVSFNVNMSGDSIWIERNDTILESSNLQTEFGVDLQGSSSLITTCFNSRGIGDASCNSHSTNQYTLFLVNGSYKYLWLMPLGGLVEGFGA